MSTSIKPREADGGPYDAPFQKSRRDGAPLTLEAKAGGDSYDAGYAAGVREAAARRPIDQRRLSQTNRGLRMILLATVAVVLISWAGTVSLQVGSDYMRHLTVASLINTDQDALRVMCAVNPPTEKEFGWMHICEAAAGAGSANGGPKAVASATPTPAPKPKPKKAAKADGS